MIIYKATNKINGKSYIGQTKYNLKKRKTGHFSEGKNDNNFFHNALRKYGQDNFEWKTLEKCDSKTELNELEFHYIKQYNTYKPNGYNLTFGGDSTWGWKPTKQTKEKISKSRKKWWEKRSAKFMENWSKKRRELMIGKNNPMFGVERLDMKGDNNPAKRPEFREKMKGDNNPAKRPEVRKKISESLKGKRRPDLIERNKRLKKTYVFQSPQNEFITYTGLIDFCEKNNLTAGHMSSILNKEKRTHRGWKVFSPENVKEKKICH